MHKETFYLDGMDAESFGIRLQRPIYFSSPVPVVDSDSIEGRNGNLIYETGAYENRTATASCFLLQKNVLSALSSANRFLLRNHGYRRLETSDKPNNYWMARIVNGAKVEQRMRTLAPFSVEFDCKPQCFLKSGERAIEFLANGEIYNNYFFDAKPLIKVYGDGDGVLYVGEYRVDLMDMSGFIFVDSELQNAYNNSGNQNMNIKCDEFPVLKDGKNEISFSGNVSKVEITPRWWEL